jgi:hypothetical protein
MLSSIKEYLPGPPTPGNIWPTLGLSSRGTTFHDLIHRGLPYEYFNLIASILRVERKVISQAIGISPASLHVGQKWNASHARGRSRMR